MPARIESVAVASSHRPVLPKAALRLADDAIAECLQRAGRQPGELDLLINAGVYREKNLAEPALAAMIQEDIGASSHGLEGSPHATFSFDVAHGGAGVVTALELISGFIASGTVALGLVVASDSNPGMARGFPFPNAGGAVLLGPGRADEGFIAFSSQAFPEYAACFESHVQWREGRGGRLFGPGGENATAVVVQPEYAEYAVACGARVAADVLHQAGLRPAEVDLVVASAYPRTFALELAGRLELPSERVAVPEPALQGAHTAGVIAALDPAFRSGKLAAGRTTLFVAAGAGICVGAAVYRS